MTAVYSSSPPPSLSPLPAFASLPVSFSSTSLGQSPSTREHTLDGDAQAADTRAQKTDNFTQGALAPSQPRLKTLPAPAEMLAASANTPRTPVDGRSTHSPSYSNADKPATEQPHTLQLTTSPSKSHAPSPSSSANATRPVPPAHKLPSDSGVEKLAPSHRIPPPQMHHSNSDTTGNQSNNPTASASSSRSGTPVNGVGHHQYAQFRAYPHHQPHSRSASPSRAPSPSPSASYTPQQPQLSHLSSQQQQQHHSPPLVTHPQLLPNMAPSNSPSQSSSHGPDSNAMQAAMMQAAYAQQQQHFQNQVAAMLAAGYSQHQLAQHFQQQQQAPFASPSMHGGQLPPPAVGSQHDMRRRAPSLPNTPHGNAGGLINNAGYFPGPQSKPHYQTQYTAQPSFHHHPHHSQQYYHPQFSQGQPYYHPHQFSPYPTPPPQNMRGSPVSIHSAPAGHSPMRERAPTAPSSLPTSPLPSSGIENSPSSSSPASARSANNPVRPAFAQPPSRPSSPGGVADLARRRAESQPNENRAPLTPTVGSQMSTVPSSQRERTGSTSSETKKAFIPPPASRVIQKSPSIDQITTSSRLRTDSGISSSSSAMSSNASAATHQHQQNRPASPASTMSDRAPTPTQALHSQLTGSSTSVVSGRTTPTASSPSYSPSNVQQQQLGLQPSIKLTNGALDSHQAGSGIIRKASPLSQQSTISDGHRSITPTQASAGYTNGVEHDSDNDTEEIASRPANATSLKHKATLSNASSTMSSSPQTPSSHKSGSSLFRNKLRKAMSMSELNNSSSTLSSGSGSGAGSSKKLGRTSLTSNSSSSDTSHSTAEPRTPPNGAPPVLPRGFASASASNLHSEISINEHGVQQSSGRATPSNDRSLPSNAGRRFGLLNSKMNSSTDNISISSTVSSASMMLRKMGNFGKLARKSSVRSLSNLFSRDKHDKNGEDEDGSVAGHGGRKVTSDAVSEFGVPGAAMVSSKDRKKGNLADPSVAHVTVELERGEASKSGMTPAEALVRKHQERERMQREEQERQARARTASASSVASTASKTGAANASSNDTASPRSKLLEKEKERLKAQNAGKKSLAKKFSFGGFGGKTSSSSLRQDALHASVSQVAGQSGDKDSPRSSSSSSSANASPIFDSSATSSSSVSPVILQHELDTNEFSKPLDIDFRPSLDGVQLDTWRKGPAALESVPSTSRITMHGVGQNGQLYDPEDDDDDFNDRTPRQSMELIGDQSISSNNTGNYSDWDGEPPNTSSFFDDDTASFKDDSDHTGRSYASASNVPNQIYMHQQYQYQDQEDYSSDGGADGRHGQAIPKRPPPHARPTKGILKNARSYSQEVLRGPQPAFASRPRASSYDAPHQMSPPNQPGKVATLAQYIPSGDELDGVADHPSSAPRQDTRVASPTEIDNDKENLSPSSSQSFSPGTSPYSHPNTSEPILSNMKSIHMAARSVTGPIVKRNISFAQNLSVHTTWSGSTYDRRGDPATCNRLTPQLAQAIKEELNGFKMNEMQVHHQSRKFTHFFV